MRPQHTFFALIGILSAMVIFALAQDPSQSDQKSPTRNLTTRQQQSTQTYISTGSEYAFTIALKSAAIRPAASGATLDVEFSISHNLQGFPPAKYSMELLDDHGNAVATKIISSPVSL